MDEAAVRKLNAVLDSCPAVPCTTGELAWVEARVNQVLIGLADGGFELDEMVLVLETSLLEKLTSGGQPAVLTAAGVELQVEVTDEALGDDFVLEVMTGQGMVDAVLHASTGFTYAVPEPEDIIEARWILQMDNKLSARDAQEVAEAF